MVAIPWQSVTNARSEPPSVTLRAHNIFTAFSRAMVLSLPHAATLEYSSACCGDRQLRHYFHCYFHNCNFSTVMNHNVII